MQQPTFSDVDGYSGFGAASPDGLGATVRMLGADEVAPNQGVLIDNGPTALKRTLAVAYGLASIAGTAVGAYHGYKRNDSVGWAIGWALLGGLFPVVVIPVAYAQGIGERKRGR
jgi:hypothetical protein